jgi:hypothetical protein
MNATKHTPGPWATHKRADGTNWEVATEARDSYGRHAEYIVSVPLDYNTSEANARLIASAPDLLAALRRIAESWDINGEGIYRGSIASQVRAAIARATGQEGQS